MIFVTTSGIYPRYLCRVRITEFEEPTKHTVFADAAGVPGIVAVAECGAA